MKRTIYKNFIVDTDNLGRLYIYNLDSPYSEDSDRKLIRGTTLEEAKEAVNQELEMIKRHKQSQTTSRRVWSVDLIKLDHDGRYDSTIQSDEFDNYNDAKKRYDYYDSRNVAVELNSYTAIYNVDDELIDIHDFGGLAENYITKNWQNISSYEDAKNWLEWNNVNDLALMDGFLDDAKNSAVRKAVHDHFNEVIIRNAEITVLDSYYVEDSYGHQQLVEIRYNGKTEYLVGWQGREAAEYHLTNQNWSYAYNVYDNLDDAAEEFDMHREIYDEWHK